MPYEYRKIVFSPEELESAVRSYARVTPRFLPAADRIACRHDSAGRLTITAHAIYGATAQEMTIEVRPEDTAALLARFCFENNITLPPNGKKRVVAHERGLALLVELEQAAVPG